MCLQTRAAPTNRPFGGPAFRGLLRRDSRVDVAQELNDTRQIADVRGSEMRNAVSDRSRLHSRIAQTDRVRQDARYLIDRVLERAVDGSMHEPHLREPRGERAERRGG